MLETERLLIRPYTTEDLPFLESLVSDPRVVRYIGNGKPRTKEGARLFFNWNLSHYKEDQPYGLHVVVEKETEEKIGHAGLVPHGKAEVELGYWIAPDHWGKGYATEAAMALKDIALHELKAESLIAKIQSGNIDSQTVAFKLGLTLREKLLVNGKEVLVFHLPKHSK
nr:GNAT family N-acetyltransferase [Terribacillus saccharophilus]